MQLIGGIPSNPEKMGGVSQVKQGQKRVFSKGVTAEELFHPSKESKMLFGSRSHRNLN